MPGFPPIYITITTHTLIHDGETGERTTRRLIEPRWCLEEGDTTVYEELGNYVLPVETIGLTRGECRDYINAKWRFDDLLEEADFAGNHSLCFVNPQLFAEQEMIMEVLGAKITAAVKARFDPWLRRRHLFAMLKAQGHYWFDEPSVAEDTAPAIVGPAQPAQLPPWAGLY
jgi:hypothetical protein